MRARMDRRTALRMGLTTMTALATTAACGGKTDTTSAPSALTSAEAGAFPVTIPHIHGGTTLTTPPQRVAVVGIGDQDSLLALGITPVLAPVWTGSTTTGIGDWSRDLVHGDPTPLQNATGDFSVEQVAAARPDLILAINNAITTDEYKRLSAIAPTVLHASGQTDWALPWQDVTRRVGQSIGRLGAADRLIADAEATVAKAKSEHPEFAGKTAVLVIRWKDGKLRAFGPEAARFQVLGGLGFTAPPALADRFAGGKLNTEVAAENFHLLDADVLIFDNWDRDRAQIENEPAFASLPVVRDKRLVGLDAVMSDAVSMPNPVTIPYVSADLVSKLTAVVKR